MKLDAEILKGKIIEGCRFGNVNVNVGILKLLLDKICQVVNLKVVDV